MKTTSTVFLSENIFIKTYNSLLDMLQKVERPKIL